MRFSRAIVLAPNESVCGDGGEGRGASLHKLFQTAQPLRVWFGRVGGSITSNDKGGRRWQSRKYPKSAPSTKNFEDAIQQGLNRAAKTLRNIRGAWVKEQHVRCDGGRITEYQVNMMVTFILDD